MRAAKAMVVTALMVVAGVAHAGDSAEMVLDLRTGPRASGGDETLLFSSLWDGGADATVTIAQDGVAIAENLAGEGERAWSVPYNGTYELTHVTYTNGVAGKVETATFVVTGKKNFPVPYLDPVNHTTNTCTDYTFYTGQTELNTGWYVVAGNITNDTRITVSGDVNLILADGASLTANEGVNVGVSFAVVDGGEVVVTNSLTIWAQSDATAVGNNAGRLIATAHYADAGIGGNLSSAGGEITVNGGNVSASCSGVADFDRRIGGAGIGGGWLGDGGTITINGGTVTASCFDEAGDESYGAGIGGGGTGAGGTITINGGTVTATGGNYGAGIGAGGGGFKDGGTITITGGTVGASSGYGAGIGGGWFDRGGDVTISGGTVTASSTFSQAIGCGIYEVNSDSGDLDFPGMKVYASETATEPEDAVNRMAACRGECVKLTLCDPHSHASYRNNGDDHTLLCQYCGAEGATEAHVYENGVCACGAIAPPEVTDVVATPTGGAWQGQVDISFNVTNDVARGLPDWNAPVLSIVATDHLTGSNYVSDVSALSARAPYQLADALAGSNGTHEVTWDFTAQGIDFSSTNVTFTVAYIRPFDVPGDYCVIDLSGGTNAAHYAVSYLDAEPDGGFTNDLYRTTKLAMRLLAPGTFTMGAVGNNYYDNPPHSVTLTQPFYCAVFETTQRQWELVKGGRPSYFNNADHYATRPVEQISWNMICSDSDNFLGVLRAKTGLAALDLPTEAQWEYACRAGTTNDFNNGKNMTGDNCDTNLNEVARYWWNGGSPNPNSYEVPAQNCEANLGTAVVGSYKPNAWGLYDMHGNVFEWCLDRWDGSSPLDANSVTNPLSSSGAYRVLRGRGWASYAGGCGSSSRSWGIPSYDSDDFGFRLVRTLSDNLESERSAEAAAGAERAGTVCAGVSAPVALVRGASVAFGGKFTLTGRAMAAGEFTAGLYDAAGNSLQTVVNAADGTFAFDAIEYTPQDAGTHVYTVRQEAGADAGILYDAAEHTVEVAVSVGADRLVVNVTDNFTALDFANVCPPPEITDVVAESGAPWDGTVTISFNVTNSPAAVCPGWNAPFLSIVATDNLTGSNYVSDAAMLTGGTDANPGPHTVTWKLGEQGIDFSSTNVTFTVAYLRMPDYCVIDLSGGTNATSYAVSYLDAEPEGGWTDLYKTTNLVMRLLAPGSFQMGVDGSDSSNPSHSVTLTQPFYCAVFETTQRQWGLVQGPHESGFAGDTRPVETVSYNDIRGSANVAEWPATNEVEATFFLGKLRSKTGIASLDLPTEAQWEYACRAGTETKYCCADSEIGNYAWYSTSATHEVGAKRPNAWGLYDMHGNVWEWCLDWSDFSSLSAFAVTNPLSSSGSYRMARGGSWYSHAYSCTSSLRGGSTPSSAGYDCGFRLVRTLSDNLEGERSAEAAAGAERAGTVCAGTSAPVAVGMKEFADGDIRLTPYDAPYDGLAHTIGIATNAIDGLVLRYASGALGESALPFGDTPPTFTDVTNVTVWVEANAPGYFAFTTNATVTITQRTVTLTSGSAEKVYDGTPVTCADVLVGAAGFAPGEGATFEVTGSQTHFGSSENFFTYALNDGTLAGNYDIVTSNGTLTVTKATNAWTTDPSLAGWTYGEAAGVPDFGGATFGTATVTYGGGQGTGLPTDAGDYTATFTVSGTEDYDGLSFEVPFTIARAAFAEGDIRLTGYEGVYDGEGHGIGIETNAIDGLVLRYAVGEGGSPGGLALPSGGHGVPALPVAATSAALPLFTNVCEATVWVEASAPNYETVTNSVTVKITARQVTLTSGSASKTYDGTPVTCADVLVGADGFAPGEGATFDVTGSQTDVGSSGNTFTYALNEGTLAGNYEITMVEGMLTVEPAEPEPQPEPQPEPPAGRRVLWPTDAPFQLDRMTTYNGYLLDANANDAVVGVIAVKAGKPSKKTGISRLMVTIRLTGQKAITVKGTTVDGTFRAMAGGRALDIALGLHSLSGAFGSYLVDGSRDMFSARDADSKSRAAQALSRWKGNYVAAWQAAGATDAPYNTLSITVKKKGRVTVKGTLANGTRVSANTRLLVGGLHRRMDTGSLLLVGEKECAVAVSWAKKGSSVACLLWFGEDGTVSCESLNDGSVAVAAPVGAGLAAGATLRIDQAAVAAAFPGISVERSFPGGVPAKLSLRYGKDGTFGGSFKVYVDSGVSFRQKTVKVSGVVLDGIGYGVAYVKNVGDWKITVE